MRRACDTKVLLPKNYHVQTSYPHGEGSLTLNEELRTAIRMPCEDHRARKRGELCNMLCLATLCRGDLRLYVSETSPIARYDHMYCTDPQEYSTPCSTLSIAPFLGDNRDNSRSKCCQLPLSSHTLAIPLNPCFVNRTIRECAKHRIVETQRNERHECCKTACQRIAARHQWRRTRSEFAAYSTTTIGSGLFF